MERLQNSHKEQSTKWDNLRVFQELKLKDLSAKISKINDTVDNDLIRRKQFEELQLTTLSLQQRVEDDMDLVTKNVREARNRMGEMTLKFSHALTDKLKRQASELENQTGTRNPLLDQLAAIKSSKTNKTDDQEKKDLS